MGFKRNSRTYNLAWAEGHDLHGLEVMARALRLGEVLKLQTLMEKVKESEAKAEHMTDLITKFSKTLVSWNYEDDDGNPVPTDMEGIEQLEDWEFYAILDAYMGAAMNVPEDLGKDSGSGKRFPVDLPPMEEL